MVGNAWSLKSQFYYFILAKKRHGEWLVIMEIQICKQGPNVIICVGFFFPPLENGQIVQ